MRQTLSIIVVCFIAVAALAGRLDNKVTSITGNMATTQTNDVDTIRGFLEEIKVVPVTAGTTGTVTFVYVPEVSGMADVVLTEACVCTSELVFRPRIDTTDARGTLLTGDAQVRHALIGGNLRATLGSVSSCEVWKIEYKWDRGY